ncbi:MAG: hypothetical protein JW715_12730 [Sedimentisphaerales bacterium]|nr:hypothetical protein [Sedimentisphaerales bacterium]
MDLIDILLFDKVLFFEMVKKCNETYRSGHDLLSYRKIIDAHHRVRNINQLIEDDDFLRTIYETLKLWNMNQQGAKLETYQTIKESILNCQDYLDDIYGAQLNIISSKELANLEDTLYLLFRDLKIMKSKRRIVGVSKTMHFLLPDLIMPTDGKYTMNAVFGYNKFSKTATAEFHDMFFILKKFHDIACKFELSLNDCSQTGWNTTVPKLIDNAIIGLTNNIDYAIAYLKSTT